MSGQYVTICCYLFAMETFMGEARDGGELARIASFLNGMPTKTGSELIVCIICGAVLVSSSCPF